MDWILVGFVVFHVLVHLIFSVSMGWLCVAYVGWSPFYHLSPELYIDIGFSVFVPRIDRCTAIVVKCSFILILIHRMHRPPQ